jgi:glucosamine-phosphate N-acetyltransferase
MEHFNIEKCVFRKINENDYHKFLLIINEFRETKFTNEQFVETLKYIAPFSEIWIIEFNHDIIATGTIIYEKKFIHNNCTLAHIEDVCVKSLYRKLGIGKLLINKLKELAKNKGCYKITLDCNEENTHFYEKCGLEKRGFQMSQLTINY